MSNNKINKTLKISKASKAPKQSFNEKITKRVKKNEVQELAGLFDNQDIRVPFVNNGNKKNVYWPFDHLLGAARAKSLLNSQINSLMERRFYLSTLPMEGHKNFDLLVDLFRTQVTIGEDLDNGYLRDSFSHVDSYFKLTNNQQLSNDEYDIVFDTDLTVIELEGMYPRKKPASKKMCLGDGMDVDMDVDTEAANISYDGIEHTEEEIQEDNAKTIIHAMYFNLDNLFIRACIDQLGFGFERRAMNLHKKTFCMDKAYIENLVLAGEEYIPHHCDLKVRHYIVPLYLTQGSGPQQAYFDPVEIISLFITSQWQSSIGSIPKWASKSEMNLHQFKYVQGHMSRAMTSLIILRQYIDVMTRSGKCVEFISCDVDGKNRAFVSYSRLNTLLQYVNMTMRFKNQKMILDGVFSQNNNDVYETVEKIRAQKNPKYVTKTSEDICGVEYSRQPSEVADDMFLKNAISALTEDIHQDFARKISQHLGGALNINQMHLSWEFHFSKSFIEKCAIEVVETFRQKGAATTQSRQQKRILDNLKCFEGIFEKGECRYQCNYTGAPLFENE